VNQMLDFLVQRLDPSTLIAVLVGGIASFFYLDENFMTKDEARFSRNEMAQVITSIRLTQLDTLPTLTPKQAREKQRLVAKQIRLDDDREAMEENGIGL